MARKQKSTPGPYLLCVKRLRERIPNPDDYPYQLPAFQGLTELPLHPKVTFLVGENGSGKSTLLEAIAVEYGLNPEGGSLNFCFATRESHASLHEVLRLVRSIARPRNAFFLRAESFYNVATEIDQLGVVDAYGGKSLHEQSHGESFFALFEHRFGEHGLYLLDEPEAALSPRRQLQFLALMHHYLQQGGQFIIATHSPILMAYPSAWIYQLEPTGLRQVNYEETEHYQITAGFLRNPKRSLAMLLDDRDPAEGSGA